MEDVTPLELGRLAAACTHFRWMPGMKVLSARPTDRCTYWGEDLREIMDAGGDGWGPVFGWPAARSGWVPDLSDPATIGCLIALVREAWGDEWEVQIDMDLHDKRMAGGLVRMLGADGKSHVFSGRTLGDVLVAALEAAP